MLHDVKLQILKSEKVKPGADSDGTRVAGNSDETRLAVSPYQARADDDPTRLDQIGYRSILLSRPEVVRDQSAERYTVGDKIYGRYEVLAINRGSMGIVYGRFDHQTKLPRVLIPSL